MLDISRDKIPTMETLYEIVDMLSMLRYNHLQLYVEGFSFGYPSFRDLWEHTETPVTGEEMQELERYAAERMIELVPNQNMLGHMGAWLATDRFAHHGKKPTGTGHQINHLFSYQIHTKEARIMSVGEPAIPKTIYAVFGYLCCYPVITLF
ncbi:MAG: hypothetical protein EA359_07710 [Balneolaceae bacterium]|nr:MAG: hypothetical protein EA359_07710 [Balneolaceae bacterium]